MSVARLWKDTGEAVVVYRVSGRAESFQEGKLVVCSMEKVEAAVASTEERSVGARADGPCSPTSIRDT